MYRRDSKPYIAGVDRQKISPKSGADRASSAEFFHTILCEGLPQNRGQIEPSFEGGAGANRQRSFTQSCVKDCHENRGKKGGA